MHDSAPQRVDNLPPVDLVTNELHSGHARDDLVTNNDPSKHADQDATILGDGAVHVTPKQLKRYSLAFAITTFGIGPAFGCAVSYMTYQMQTIAYSSMIGHNPGMPPQTGCFALDQPCLVPFGYKDINLTSLFLYLNAISYGVSGFLTLFVCGLGDYFHYKKEQYIFGLIAYGAFCLPAAGLTAYKLSTFNGLAILYTIFNVIGFLVQAWMNIFVPYTMHAAAPVDSLSAGAKIAVIGQQTDQEVESMRAIREREGVKISVWGGVSMNVGLVIFYCITIGLTYANYEASLYAGLYMTTVAGGICILTALVGWRMLPAPHGKPVEEVASLFRGVYAYPEAFKFLLAYTIYNDSNFAFGTVIGTLFINVVRPSLNEYTAYSITGSATSIVGALSFMYLFPRLPLTLRHWSIGCYSLVCFVAFWCVLGLSVSSAVGFKHRSEFYIFMILQNLAGSILSPLFRVLYSELFPKGSEIQYFGFQLVLSCSTVWIPQIVDGPIVEATNNQRLPAIIAFIFFLTATAMVVWMKDKDGVAKIRREEVETLRAAST